MTIAISTYTTGYDNGVDPSFDLTVPTGTVSGDLLLIAIVQPPAVTLASITGFTAITGAAKLANDYLKWFYRIAGSSESSYAISATGDAGSDYVDGVCIRVTGAGATPYFIAETATHGTPDATVTAPDITTLVANSLVVWSADGTPDSESLASFTGVTDLGLGWSSLVVGYAAAATPGLVTGPGSSQSTQYWNAISLAISATGPLSTSFTATPSVLLTLAGTDTTWTQLGSSVSITDVTGTLSIAVVEGSWNRTSDTAATLEVSGTGTGTFTVTIDTVKSPTITVTAGSVSPATGSCVLMGL